MKRYDPAATCPKCGCTAIGTKFETLVMRRRCGKCLYEWAEDPLDAPEKVEEGSA